MKNLEIAKIFYEMADYFEMEEIDFKPFAYRKAAVGIESAKEDIDEIYKNGGKKALEEIPGVGKNLALKIEEYIRTGKISRYERLKKETPVDLEKLMAVEGIGPRKIKQLYQKLKIKNLKDLEKKAKSGEIAGLEGFGETSEKNILEGIEFVKRSKGRFLLGKIMPSVEDILKKLSGLKEVSEIIVAGSARRMKETIGDVDILAVSKNPKKVADFFATLPEAAKVWSRGLKRVSIRTKSGFDVDLRIVPEKSFGSALQYFTGSKEHNIATRRIAIEKGLKLNEYGVFRGKKMITGKTEEDVYKAIGLAWIPAEIRENSGEIEAAIKGKLPELIGYDDIKGDLHCHSNWDGGENSIEEMAQAAIEMGYQYIGISDHTKFLRIEEGLDEEKLLLQKKEIDRINSEIPNSNDRCPNKFQNPKFKILQGCETNILADGSVDISDEVLGQLDFVIAGVHSGLKTEKEKMTERLIKAMRNPNIDIISHPTGRLIQERDEYQIDFDKILEVAKETGTILEINSSPDRLDLKDSNIRKAKEAGVKMIINTDSHDKIHLGNIKYGIAQARRGWAEKDDIINTQSLTELLAHFK